MNLKSQLFLIGVSGLTLLYSCNNDPKTSEQEQKQVIITNNDIEQAKELVLPNPVTDTTWLFDSSNTGFGQRQDFNPDSALVKNMFGAEENTDWFKFVAPGDTSLGVTVEPNDPTAEYDMVVFKSTGDSIGPDLRKGLVPAIRSNFAKLAAPEDTITGLKCDPELPDYISADGSGQFSRAFWAQAGETYYVVLNTPTAHGKGYKLRIHSCAPGTGGPRHSGSHATGHAAVQDAQATSPEITKFNPSRAAEGVSVRISGKHLTGASSVRFGGEEATSFEVISDTEIKATVNQGASGNIEVVTSGGNAEKSGFIYLAKQAVSRKKATKRKVSRQPSDNGDYYIVKPKETMFSIAFIFGMTVEEVLKINNLTNTNVFVGQKLKVIRRQLSQTKIDRIQKTAVVIPPSPPVENSTTSPAVIAEHNAIETKPATPVVAPGTPRDVKANPFTQTPNFPDNSPKASPLEDKNSIAPADKSFWVYCNVTSGVNKQAVGGTLQIVDLKKKDLVYNVQANKTQKVPLFNAGGSQKLFICDIFGYKKQDFDLNLNNIINDSTDQQVVLQDDTIVINFELRRLEQGDVAVAYNIFFYDDASVMLPKSTYELDQLLELMNENKKIKIKIHGHTNTSKLGEILYLEKGDQTFFRLTNKNKKTFGPAKLLSKKRAETIKWYLESKRITDDRIQVEGHGGSEMLFPNTHPLAFKNKRVEVEILADK